MSSEGETILMGEQVPAPSGPYALTTSATIGQIAKALSVAQGHMKAAEFDRENPGFHFRYATIASIWDAIREPLSVSQLAVTQIVSGLQLITMLVHSSGEFFRSDMKILAKDLTPQGFGSGMTYARRYCLQAIVGAASADEDDDGQEASAPVTKAEPKAKAAAPKPAATADRHPVTDHICPIHKEPFLLFTRPDGAKWYSHKVGDAWCNETAMKAQAPAQMAPQKPAQPQDEADAPQEGEQGTATLEEHFGPAEHAPEAKPDITANGILALEKQLGWPKGAAQGRLRLEYHEPGKSLPTFTDEQREWLVGQMLDALEAAKG